MKTVYAAALLLGLFAASPSWAGEAEEAAATRLLDAMDMRSVLEDTMDAALEAQLAQQPQMVPFKAVFQAFLAKHMRYELLKPKLAAVYAAEFSASELDEVAAFYSTPTGKKFLAKMPALFSKGVEIGQQAVVEHLPELQAALKEEAARMQPPATKGEAD